MRKIEKKIVFLIKYFPYNTLNSYEALRAAISCFEHEVFVLWMEDGVYLPTKRSDHTLTEPFLRLSGDMGVTLYVDEDDLKERGLSSEDLTPQTKPIEKTRAIALLRGADFVMTF